MADDGESDETEESTESEVAAPAGDGPDSTGSQGRIVGEDEGEIDFPSLANHTVYVALVFAAAGLGFGIVVFLIARYGADPTIIPGQNRTQDAFVTLFINNNLNVAMIFPLFLAPVTGLVVNFSIDDDLTALVSAAAGGFAGAVLFVMLAGTTADLQYPMVRTMGRTVQGTFDVKAGLVNSFLVGFVTAIVGGTSAVIGQLLE